MSVLGGFDGATIMCGDVCTKRVVRRQRAPVARAGGACASDQGDQVRMETEVEGSWGAFGRLEMWL